MLLLTRRIVLIFKIGAWKVSKIAMPKWTTGEFKLCVKVKKKKKRHFSAVKSANQQVNNLLLYFPMTLCEFNGKCRFNQSY